jgi:hypothetical protein
MPNFRFVMVGYNSKNRLIHHFRHHHHSYRGGTTAAIRTTTTIPFTRRFVSSSSSSSAQQQQQYRRHPIPPMPRIFPNIPNGGGVTSAAAAAATTANSSSGSGNSIVSKLRAWWDDGTILLFLGWSGALLMTIDAGIQYYSSTSILQDGDDILDKDAMLNEIVYDAQLQRQYIYQQYQNAPTLYQCRIVQGIASRTTTTGSSGTRTTSLGGSHGLRHVPIQAVVDIVEEHVGPQQLYHMCRYDRRHNGTTHKDTLVSLPPATVAAVSHPSNQKKKKKKDHRHDDDEYTPDIEIGWYPISHMEPIPIPQRGWRQRYFWFI